MLFALHHDILSVIMSYLNNTDLKIINNKIDNSLLKHIIDCGYLNIIKYMWHNGCAHFPYICITSAENGYLDVLQWARDKGGMWSDGIHTSAAYCGQIEILQWLLTIGYELNTYTCADAALGGHLDVLK